MITGEPAPAFDRRSFRAFAAPALLAQSGLELRPVCSPADRSMLATIYASTRSEELRQVAWTPEQKRAFTDWQSTQQERHYGDHYPGFERLLISDLQRKDDEADACPVGRVYVHTASEVRLMDITLLPAHRNHGIGSVIVSQLLLYAGAFNRPVSLHVEPFNPAKRMYERLGFKTSETRGLYDFMIRPDPTSETFA